MIRQLRHDEIDQFVDMTEVAFAVSFTPEEREARRKQVVPEQIWGYYRDDRLAARVAILPLRIMVQGVAYEMGGIAHVATYPELRRGGLVSKLIVRSLEEMKRSGQTVSMLNPFSFAFYRKFGWEWFCDLVTYSVESRHLPRFKDTAGQIKRGGEGDLGVVAELYAAYTTRFNGMLVRDEAWWKSTVFRRKLGQLALYCNDRGEPEGYMLYAIRDRRFRIHEWIPLSADSRKGLWQFVANHDSIVDSVDISMPADDPTAHWFAEPGTAGRKLYPYYMARIVDLEPFLRLYPFATQPPGSTLRITVQDEHAPWNGGTWELQWLQGGGFTITRVNVLPAADGTEAGGDEWLACDICTLSSLLLGSSRPAALWELGRLRGRSTAVELLERTIPRRTPYLLDMF
ncbi:enhanced intracellular survival protein Eis [Paenibacillus sp. HJGM_3]|uniref:GNAT family N-acetyltransferase n=1 Tax=Paenibacillus sp. HJGM_3 TaxID=3379816 RepID=UPI0038597E32